MKYLKYALLLCLLLIALSLCGTAVLWVMEKLFHVAFDSLLFAGFKAGLLACALLGIARLVKGKKRKDNN